MTTKTIDRIINALEITQIVMIPIFAFCAVTLTMAWLLGV